MPAVVAGLRVSRPLPLLELCRRLQPLGLVQRGWGGLGKGVDVKDEVGNSMSMESKN